MTQICDAVYENGQFRPLAPLGSSLVDGQQVRLVVETEATPADILSLAAQVYAGLAPQDIDNIENIALDRSVFFTDGSR